MIFCGSDSAPAEGGALPRGGRALPNDGRIGACRRAATTPRDAGPAIRAAGRGPGTPGAGLNSASSRGERLRGSWVVPGQDEGVAPVIERPRIETGQKALPEERVAGCRPNARGDVDETVITDLQLPKNELLAW